MYENRQQAYTCSFSSSIGTPLLGRKDAQELVFFYGGLSPAGCRALYPRLQLIAVLPLPQAAILGTGYMLRHHRVSCRQGGQ